MFTKMSNRLL